jgi:protein TonB
LAAWVRSHQRYPEDARRQGEEGAVTVRFTVSRDGKVLDAELVQHGGSGLLEQAALAMLRGARAPAFPAQMAQQQVTITITIRYRLQD